LCHPIKTPTTQSRRLIPTSVRQYRRQSRFSFVCIVLLVVAYQSLLVDAFGSYMLSGGGCFTELVAEEIIMNYPVVSAPEWNSPGDQSGQSVDVLHLQVTQVTLQDDSNTAVDFVQDQTVLTIDPTNKADTSNRPTLVISIQLVPNPPLSDTYKHTWQDYQYAMDVLPRVEDLNQPADPEAYHTHFVNGGCDGHVRVAGRQGASGKEIQQLILDTKDDWSNLQVVAGWATNHESVKLVPPLTFRYGKVTTDNNNKEGKPVETVQQASAGEQDQRELREADSKNDLQYQEKSEHDAASQDESLNHKIVPHGDSAASQDESIAAAAHDAARAQVANSLEDWKEHREEDKDEKTQQEADRQAQVDQERQEAEHRELRAKTRAEVAEALSTWKRGRQQDPQKDVDAKAQASHHRLHDQILQHEERKRDEADAGDEALLEEVRREEERRRQDQRQMKKKDRRRNKKRVEDHEARRREDEPDADSSGIPVVPTSSYYFGVLIFLIVPLVTVEICLRFSSHRGRRSHKLPFKGRRKL